MPPSRSKSRCRGRGPAPEAIHLPEYSWNRVKQINRNIARARERGWHLAAQSLFGDLADAGRSLERELEEALRGLARRTQPRLPASLSTIYLDLRALESEFEEVEIDLKTHELVVTTDTIELDGVLLGAFQIRLTWTDIGQTVRRPIGSWPLIRTHRPVVTMLRIPTSRTSNSARATAVPRSPPPWPKAGSMISFCW